MILNVYLIREVAKPLAAMCALLVVIFASYSSALYLADAADRLLPTETVITLILLKTVIALEMLLPIALYLSVVVGLGRMHTDHEMTALAASGVSRAQVLGALLRLYLVIAVLVGSLSLYVRPWAYQKSYWLRAQAESEFDIAELEAGRFFENEQANRVIYVEKLDRRRNRMERVFVQSPRGDATRVVFAEQAYQPDTATRGMGTLVFLHGHVYRLDRHGNKDRIYKFNKLTLHLQPREIVPVGYKRKAAPTGQLAQSTDREDTAEFQWRLSTPLATVLLGMLAVPLSGVAPRKGKYTKMLIAVLIFAVYFNLRAMAKTWVEQGVLGPVPGIWWVDALLSGLLVALLLRPERRLRSLSALC